MNLNDYQNYAMETAIYPNRGKNVEYPTLGLCGEAGEFANKVKKIQRDCGGILTDEYKEKLSEELGDVLWYIALLADEIGLTLDDVATRNIIKLRKRVVENKVHGEGDRR